MEHVVIRGGGLEDPIARDPTPALQLDYNIHNLNKLLIEDNRGDGLFIYRNDITDSFKLRNSVVRRNGGSGVSTRSSFFQVDNCILEENRVSGWETFKLRVHSLKIH